MSSGPAEPVGLALRPARPDDAAFLTALFVESLPAALQALPPGMPLVAQMQAGQVQSWLAAFGTEGHQIITRRGVPVGRVWTARGEPAVLRLVHVAVRRAAQRGGVATWALRHVVSLADAEGRRVVLRVARDNVAAQALYARLGLQVIAEDALDLTMAREPVERAPR